ncbi:MAG: hypothetical protein EA001_00185 [Oscillatoriales cyanobacterium]|nr:MAG: hypothetical protein EA001_00185 [Oscillatoriales cyanobacterium]
MGKSPAKGWQTGNPPDSGAAESIERAGSQANCYIPRQNFASLLRHLLRAIALASYGVDCSCLILCYAQAA